VNQLNNILVIGMTNRKDMIDEALLRPGRLEIHMEIGLPDEKGRLQILGIHTQKMRDNKKMGSDVSLEVLAGKCKNFSGAEIEGLVKSATAYALNEVVNADDVGKNLNKVQTPMVKMIHFENALTEVIPGMLFFIFFLFFF
jgi:vesicle-fusing ATPase